MDTIISIKCSFCNKLLLNKQSCRTHEYRCYFNPKTKSCAACAFFIFKETKIKNGSIISYQACMVNIDITKKLLTGCIFHLPKKYLEDEEIMEEVRKNYKPEIFIKAAIDRLIKVH